MTYDVGNPGPGLGKVQKKRANTYIIVYKTRCCTLRHAKNTPTHSFVSRTVNRKQMCGKPEKGRHGTSHHDKAIYQI